MKSLMRGMKNNVMKYDEAERRIREATSNDPDFCTTDLMLQIVEDIKDDYRYKSTVDMLTKRMQDFAHLNHVLKSLILIEFLLRHAESNFVHDMTAKLDVFKKLRGYKCYDNAQNEVGGDARKWAANIVKLLEDPGELKKRRIDVQGKRDLAASGANPEEKNNPDAENDQEDEEEVEEEEKPKKKTAKKKPKQDEEEEEENEEEVAPKKKKSPKKKTAAQEEEDAEEEEEETPKKKKPQKKKPVEEPEDEDEEEVKPKKKTAPDSPKDADFDEFLDALEPAAADKPQASGKKAQPKPGDPLDFLFQ
jgi:septum formation inhibitor MinC